MRRVRRAAPAARIVLAACAALLAAAACHSPSVAAPPPSPAPRGTSARDSAAHTPLPVTARDSARRDRTVTVPDVVREAARLFGDSILAVSDPPDFDAGPPRAVATVDASAATGPIAVVPPGPVWDIDVRSFETRSRVTYFVARFQDQARPRFTGWLVRGGRYEAMIRAKMRAAALPEDLTYLALIESGYDPNAYSSAAAVGIWQLMTSTARGAGLRVDWWIDERRDPVRATDGAIKFLGWLRQQFGSLFLAAAAYNGGPGRVARGLTRYADEIEGKTGDEAFFELAGTELFRAETRDYVPKLLAAALIAKDPARYGFDVNVDPPLVYDSVRISAGVSLAAVARAARTTLGAVLELNPQILRGMTPPRDEVWVRVPPGSGVTLGSLLASLPSSDRAGTRRIVLKNSATITSVSHKYGISSRQFLWFNPELRKTRSGRVPAGTALRIPSAPTLAGARDVPDPAIERYGSSRRRAATHIVRAGETLASIAARYHVTAAAIMRLNGLGQSVIYPGQVLLLRPVSAHKKKPAARSSP